jgi:hypothetical protein
MFVLITETGVQCNRTYATALAATVASSSVDVDSGTQNQRRKGKDNVFSLHTVKDTGQQRYSSTHSRLWVVSFMSWMPYRGGKFSVPSEQEIAWPTERVCTLWRKKYVQPLQEIEPRFLGCPGSSYPLYRLRHLDFHYEHIRKILIQIQEINTSFRSRYTTKPQVAHGE